jgi:hypothetical protein
MLSSILSATSDRHKFRLNIQLLADRQLSCFIFGKKLPGDIDFLPEQHTNLFLRYETTIISVVFVPGDMEEKTKELQRSRYGTKEKSINKTLKNQIFFQHKRRRSIPFGTHKSTKTPCNTGESLTYINKQGANSTSDTQSKDADRGMGM